MQHFIKDLINKLEQASQTNLKVIGFVPNLDLEIDRTLPVSAFNSQKAILMLIASPVSTVGKINTNHSLLRQLRTFTDEEGEDDPPGEICWDKEVLLSHGESYGGDNSTTFYFPIDAIEITENTFKLIAGNELLELRTIEVNGVATRNGIVC